MATQKKEQDILILTLFLMLIMEFCKIFRKGTNFVYLDESSSIADVDISLVDDVDISMTAPSSQSSMTQLMLTPKCCRLLCSKNYYSKPKHAWYDELQFNY